MDSKLRIIVTGIIAQHPHMGGVAWDYIQYAAGLHELGHDVYYFEDSGEWPYNLDGGPTGNEWIAYDPTRNIRHLAEVMSRFGLGDRWAYRFPIKPRWYGLAHTKRREILRTADMLINVSGTLKRPADYRDIPRLVYVDSDPVFTQVKLNIKHGQLKFQKRVAAHDVFFSFGECVQNDVLPETQFKWLPTRTPILLSEWRPAQSYRDVFTTVMSWTSYKPLRFARKTYAQKDVEFLKFIELPKDVEPTKIEVALSKTQHVNWQTNVKNLPPQVASMIGQGDWRPSDVLERMGWQVADPAEVCSTLEKYRSYIESSKAEWSVAKNGYVVGHSGWFSCRSACYLAAGRPVVVQDTGFSGVLPDNEGIIKFRSTDEAIDAIREVETSYDRHCRAAREIADEYFDSNKVLACLIDDSYKAV